MRGEKKSRVEQAHKVANKRAPSAPRRSPLPIQTDDNNNDDNHGTGDIQVFTNAANRDHEALRPIARDNADVKRGGGKVQRTMLLVFWCKEDEQPQPQEIVLRSPNKVHITDYACIRAAHDVPWFPFDYWSEHDNGWRLLASTTSDMHVDDFASMLLVRLTSVKVCVGLGHYLQTLETHRKAIAMSQDIADAIAVQARSAITSRPAYQSRAWVVVWTEDDDFPVVETVEICPLGNILLSDHWRLRGSPAALPGNDIEVWDVNVTTWKGCQSRVPYSMRMRQMSLLGLEMELCAMSIQQGSQAQASLRSVHSRRRSPSIEIVAAPSRAPITRWTRSPSAEIIAGPSRAPLARWTRSPSLEIVAGPSRAPRTRQTRSPSIEFLD
ncbi:hypothetical protein BV20DRAFT_983822 [Pilatotrama ljubarskyi]|nr:hypothetical protein BV20DRAFT_983822 [Pilatotrama ljubarskyi]